MTMQREKKKIAILSRSFATGSRRPLEFLDEHGYEYHIARNGSPQDKERIAKTIGDADGVIVGSDVIDSFVLDRCKNLKVISKHGVGLDSIDTEAAKKRGIMITTTGDANTESVADFTIMLMLAVIRNLKVNILNDPSPLWEVKGLSSDLYGKTVGLLGYGKIGRSVAQRLSGFCVRILVYDPYIVKNVIVTDNTRLCGLDSLLEESDVVSLHLPLTEQTRHLFNRHTFSKMKDHAVLINTARGGLVDLQDLGEALKTGGLLGAGLDVFPNEPPTNEPALCLPNVIATPHIATHTKEANCRMGMAAVKNIDFYMAGER
jgi:D-3-phosphoglycerate dehydrogenase